MKITNDKLENLRKNIVDYSNAVFTSFLIGYLLLFLFESYKKGFVSYYFNLNIFLWILGLSGVLLVLFKEESDLEKTELLARDNVFIIFIGIIGGIIVYLQTAEIGYLSVVIGVISSTIIIILSYLLLNDNEK